MKKILIVIFMFIILTFVACSAPEEIDAKDDSLEDEIINIDSTDDLADVFFVEDDKVVEVGLPAPIFELENLDLEGENINLSDYRGRYVLINFWATWCGYCKDEMPDLQAFLEENEDLAVIAVNVEEPRELVEKYIKEGGYTFDVALDSNGDLSRAYYVSAFPTSIFIDRYGNLIGGVPGYMAKDDMEKILDYVKVEEAKLRNK